MLKYLLGIGTFLLFLSSSAGILSTLYFITNKYDELDCDNLRDGILVGLGSIILLAISIFMFICNCCNRNICIKIVLFISCLLILISTGYNGYLYDNRSDNCTQYYKNNNVDEYYNYYIYGLLINSAIIIFTSLCFCCCKTD
jgi:hypothetical protein